MNVQVCDMQSENFAKELMQSLQNTGFAVLTNHGIPFELIRRNQDLWRQFFKSPDSVKDWYVNVEDGNLGYKKIGSETAVGSKVPDVKAFFHYQPYSDIPPYLIEDVVDMYYDLENVGFQILSILDDQKYVNWSFKEACQGSNNTILRALYYPPMSEVDYVPGAVRAAAHEDINFITLLVAATSSGLEVKDAQGNWHAVPHEDNSIVVNVSDMMQLATGGRLKSTTHRVVNPANANVDRISLPLFLHPHSEVMLTPEVKAQDYLNERIAQIYAKT